MPGSPAAEAGIRDGDVVYGVEGTEGGWNDVLEAVAASAPGESVAVVIGRDGVREVVNVAVGTSPDGKPMMGLMAVSLAE
jgi:S1-C subfamily serine protease